jgi:hypothetical protein
MQGVQYNHERMMVTFLQSQCTCTRDKIKLWGCQAQREKGAVQKRPWPYHSHVPVMAQGRIRVRAC